MLSRRRAKADGGFTLIELLVVIIIIGILAAIAIPVFLNQRQKAQDAAAKSDIQGLALNMETYRLDNPSYPTTSDQLEKAGLTPKTSPGVQVMILSTGSTTEGYCLAATNSTGTPSASWPGYSATVIYWWDSNAGGLQKPTSICPSFPAANVNPYAYWPHP